MRCVKRQKLETCAVRTRVMAGQVNKNAMGTLLFNIFLKREVSATVKSKVKEWYMIEISTVFYFDFFPRSLYSAYFIYLNAHCSVRCWLKKISRRWSLRSVIQFVSGSTLGVLRCVPVKLFHYYSRALEVVKNRLMLGWRAVRIEGRQLKSAGKVRNEFFKPWWRT